MEAQVLPEPVCRFVLHNIDSIAHLEALLLLYNAPETPWDKEAVAQRLYISADSAQQILERLKSLGLAAQTTQSFRFSSEDASLREQVAELAGYYTTHLIAVTTLIHAKPPASRIEEFAKAFVFRRES
jgi:hypothetical protein